MTLSFFSCSRSALLYSIIIIGAFFIFGQIGVTHAATPVPPTLQSPANTWATTITTNNVNLTWSYPALDPSIWFYLYILKWDSATLTWKPYLAKYVGVTTQDRETFTDRFYAWQLAAVDITQSSNPWYQWANDWNKLKVGAGATPTPTPTPTGVPTITPTPTPAGSPTPTPTPCPTCPTYYISPNGLDTNSGTSPTAPLKTFNKAIPLLKPGYTLILEDGTYTKTTTGIPSITCGTNAQSGTASSPITIKAQNERKAELRSDGSVAALHISNCSYWNIVGLHGSSDDLSSTNGGSQASIFQVSNSSHIDVNRVIVDHSNRCQSVHAYLLENGTTYSTVENSEAYYYHKWAGIDYNGSHNIWRRNYANSRYYGGGTVINREGVYQCTNPGGGGNDINLAGADFGWGFYGDSETTIEDNIVENAAGPGIGGSGGIQNTTLNRNNAVWGFIGISNGNGIQGSVTSGISYPEQETTLNYKDLVLIGNGVGIYNRGSWMTVNGATVYGSISIGGSSGHGIDTDNNQNQSLSSNKITNCTNCLIYNNTTFGTNILSQNSWLLNYVNSYNPGYTNYNPSEGNISDQSGNIQNSMSTAPTGIGLSGTNCVIYVPATSNMHGVGLGGADIGADMRYAHDDAGNRTSTKLWDANYHFIGCGAPVTGLNDDPNGSTTATSACLNIQNRLNLGVGKCTIP